MTLPTRLHQWLCLVLAVVFLSPKASAVDQSCPWMIKSYFSKSALKAIDPSDQKAVQALLQDIFENPRKRLSAEDEVWVRDFNLEEVVQTVRKEGERIRKQVKLQKITKTAAATLGASFSVGLLVKHMTEQAVERIDLEDIINKQYGLGLSGNSQEELRFIKSVLDCNPKKTELKNLSEEVRDLRLYRKVKDLALVLIMAGDEGTDESYGKLVEIYKRSGISLCTRWGHPSSNRFHGYELDTIYGLTERFPHNFLKSLKNLHGFVKVSSEYQPKFAIASGTKIAGVYMPLLERIEIYSLDEKTPESAQKNEFSVDVIVHEIGHSISRELHIGRTLTWPPLNWNFTLENGWEPKKDKWFPSEYSKENIEECWAEFFACYFNEHCKAKLIKENKETFQFIDDLIWKR